MGDLTVCKHNDLIENFIFNATELELQVLNYAVAVTNPLWDNNNLVYELRVTDLTKAFKNKSTSAHRDYTQAIKKLMHREYSYRDEKGKKHTENLVTRITEDLHDNTWFAFRFNDYISARISNLKGFFTRYKLENIAMFNSRYAFLLYEYFQMQLQLHSPFSKKMSIESLREKIALESKYASFKDLERRVLKGAQTNINKHSNITLNYDIIRGGVKGRTPTHILFKAKFKAKKDAKLGTHEEQKELQIEQAQEAEKVVISPEQQARNKQHAKALIAEHKALKSKQH